MRYSPRIKSNILEVQVPSLLNHKTKNTLQVDRAKKIQNYLLKTDPDIAVFQEVWGPGTGEILNSILNTTPHYSFKPTLFGDLWYTITNWITKTGGLLIMYKQKLKRNYNHTFTVSATSSCKGIQACLLQVKDGNDLLLFNTHLDAFDAKTRLIQLSQVNDFMTRVISSVVDTSKLAVVVVGDFNIGSHSKDYEMMKKSIGGDFVRDLGKETGFAEQHTYDRENSLIEYPENSARIDYVFAIDQWMVGSRIVQFSKIKVKDYQIVKWIPGEELSDHWGNLVEFEIN